jgi:hypothetical protein
VEWVYQLSPRARGILFGSLLLLCVVALAVFAASARRASTADQALEAAFKKYPQLQRQPVARFSGQVTIDGQPPGELSPQLALFVCLHRKQSEPAGTSLLRAKCDSTGRFSFNTYAKADGVAVGSYVVTFSKLHRVGRAMLGAFSPPDELKNLYNDPDKNAQKPEFAIDVKTPGKTDYHFDLNVAGQEPVDVAGPNAVTRIGTW